VDTVYVVDCDIPTLSHLQREHPDRPIFGESATRVESSSVVHLETKLIFEHEHSARVSLVTTRERQMLEKFFQLRRDAGGDWRIEKTEVSRWGW
jgi:hypothetical protein